MAAKVVLVALVLTLLSGMVAGQLYTVCNSGQAAWSVYNINTATGSMSFTANLDLDTSNLINTTLAAGGDVGIHYNSANLFVSFAYNGGFGQGTLVRRLGTNFQSENNDRLFTTSSSAGFTGDCNGNLYLASDVNGYVNTVIFGNANAATSKSSLLRTLSPESLGYDLQGHQFVSMEDGPAPDSPSATPRQTAYLTTLDVATTTTKVEWLNNQYTDNSFMDGVEVSFDGTTIYRLTANNSVSGLTSYSRGPLALIQTVPLSPQFTCLGLTLSTQTCYIQLPYHLVSTTTGTTTGGVTTGAGTTTGSSSSSTTGGGGSGGAASNPTGLLYGRKK